MLIQGVTATGAGATTTNVLTGSLAEFIRAPSLLEIGLVDDTQGEQRVTVTSGADVLLEESSISRQARVPVYPDDFLIRDTAMPGDRLVVKVRNTGAASRNLYWAVRITEL